MNKLRNSLLCLLLLLAVAVAMPGSIFAEDAVGESSVSAQYGGSIYNEGTVNMSGGKVYGGSAQYGGNIYNTGILHISGLADVFDGIAGTLGHNISNAPGSTFTNSSTVLDSSAVFNMHATCTCGSNAEPHMDGCVNEPTQVWTMWTSTDSLPTSAGYYYLAEDVTINANQVIDTNCDIYIDLNGKTITRDTAQSDNFRVFNMIADNDTTASLTLLDSVGTGRIELGNSSAAGSFLLLYGGNKTFTMYGGTVNGGSVSNSADGAVIRNVGQTVNLYGGSIIGGTTAKSGGAVYTSGTLNLVGTSVTGGTASMGGNIFVAASGVLNISDPSLVTGGTATGSGYANTGNICYEDNGFQVGFGKASITPTTQVMTGEGVLGDVIEPIYSTAVVMKDASGGIYIHVVLDLSWGGINTTKQNGMADYVRGAVLQEFGISSDHVTVGGTHNHSSVVYSSTDELTTAWRTDICIPGVVESIRLAMADCACAEMYIGTTETESLTFVRRYLTTDPLYNGYWDGFNKLTEATPSGLSHESEADEQIQMVKFVREGKQSILMVNWQSHATTSDGNAFVGPDFIGPLRDKIEEQMGVNCVFYQGACGNLAPTSRIKDENRNTLSGSWEAAVAHGEMVADHVIEACQEDSCFTKVNTGFIQIEQISTTAASSKDTDAVKYENANKILTYRESYSLTETNAYALELGFESYYHAKAFSEHYGIPQNYPYELNTITIGDVSFVTLPVELSDVTGMQIKDATPYKMTLLLGYTCGSGEYVMHDEAFENGGYETYNTYFARGTAELMRDQYLTSLNDLYDSRY